MNTYRILIKDREYTSCLFQNPETNMDIETSDLLSKIQPWDNKLFSKDVFSFNDKNEISIQYSPTRSNKTHAGVLLLSDGRTYGRTENNKRVLYKCIPDDRHLPAFLIPYDIKMGFSKYISNKFIIFRFDHWNGKHPSGIIEETVGNVDNLEAFYEYQLYCKSLHTSITDMTRNARNALNRKTIDEHYTQIMNTKTFQLKSRNDDYIFTIDPINSLDYDDGFGICDVPDYPTKKRVSIYIANVYVWLETLGLWSSFSQRVATIYLPDYRRPMLPTVLSDALCSLQADEQRFAFIMDIEIDEDGTMGEPTFCNASVKVSKNYRYETNALLADTKYRELFDFTAKLDSSVMNSHDLVSYWMIQMNTQCARMFIQHKIGIFRSATYIHPEQYSDVEDTSLKHDTKRIIRLWNNTVGQYVSYTENGIFDHALMKLKTYIHITSPIRRLVDLLNFMIFSQSILKIQFSENALQFLETWMSKMDYINASMRSIRKVQADCELLYRCSMDPNLMDHIHQGIIFDRMEKNDGSFSYMVFLEKWKLISRINTRQDLQNYTMADFKLYVFEDEHKTKRKIRLQLKI
jgi:exoribonuclease R